MTTFLIGLFLLLFALFGTSLFVIIAAIALFAFYFLEIDSSAVIIELYRLASQPVLLAIPLFTFAGYLLAESKTPQRLVALSRAFLIRFSTSGISKGPCCSTSHTNVSILAASSLVP